MRFRVLCIKCFKRFYIKEYRENYRCRSCIRREREIIEALKKKECKVCSTTENCIFLPHEWKYICKDCLDEELSEIYHTLAVMHAKYLPIRNETLVFIKKHDPELYKVIMPVEAQ